MPASHDLLRSVTELSSLLSTAVGSGSWLDAYLFAAGIDQVIEDYVHCDPLRLAEVADMLGVPGGPRRRMVAGAVRWLSQRAQSAIGQLRMRAVVPHEPSLSELLNTLAHLVASDGAPEPAAHRALVAGADALLLAVKRFPRGLRHRILRLPACFHDFDQQPADLARLAADFARGHPDPDQRILVAGLRSSGSYLAPLCASFLRIEGFRDVRTVTVRPGRRLFGHERAAIRDLANEGGSALIVDDPPGTGRAIARIAGELERCGFAAEAITLVLQLFGSRRELPTMLSRYRSVLLPQTEWAAHARLAPVAVAEAMNELVGPDLHVKEVEPLPLAPPREARGHIRRLYRIRLECHESGSLVRDVLVQGVGLGYFGQHALLLARRLRHHVPTVYGERDGFLYREWLPESRRAASMSDSDVRLFAHEVAGYVVARHGSLRVSADASTGLVGQDPTWEVVSRMLSRAYGRGWLVARVLLDVVVRRILVVRRPSVTDGNTGPSQWFTGEDGTLVKVGFHERTFWHLGLCSYDPVFDLAGACAYSERPDLSTELRRCYRDLTDEPIDGERWVLYQLAQLWGHRRAHPDQRGEMGRACSRAVQEYFAELYLGDVTPNPAGPLCAIDIDGVLETEALGFPGTSRAGALTLRALTRHGYRPVLVSGRSANEVGERCRAYRLAAGVAEYGGVLVTGSGKQSRALVAEEMRPVLARLRAALSRLDGVHHEPAYAHSIRAFQVDGVGRRHGLPAAKVAEAVAAVGPSRIQALQGEAQTDFVPAGIDKGVGVRALAGELGVLTGPGRPLLALAVGDAAPDLPMLDLAQTACAPANADQAVRRSGVEIMARPSQRGLFLAASRLLGHLPGQCPVCRPPDLSRRAELLVPVLSAHEDGTRGLVRALCGLGWSVAATRAGDEHLDHMVRGMM